MSPLPLLPLLILTAAAKTTPPAQAPGGCGPAPPPAAMAPWPEQFHAVGVTNLTASGGLLQQIDLYYDWPRGRALNVIRDRLSSDPLLDVQWANGTVFLFDAAAGSCLASHFAVGLLPPDWKTARGGGATYLGHDRVDGFDCHVWSNFIFARYFEDVATGRPVSWIANGMQRHVLSFEVGGVPQDSSKWQAQEYWAFPKPKGLNPSVAIAIRTFLASVAKSGQASLKCVHASASDGCTITLGLARLPSLCQRICFAVCGSMYNRCNLGISGR